MRYLVTGGAGFIGSNLTEKLLENGEYVVVLDNLSTGKWANIEQFLENERFTFIEGTITDIETCALACEGIDYVLHHAAYISVPGSVEDPVGTTKTNVDGTVNVFTAARDTGVKTVVWASSTAVYGNSDILPNIENMPLCPLSPYAASKAACEMFARAFCEVYGMKIIGLRYFNVFGRRQDPSSAYAAVIPLFISGLLGERKVSIFGDGHQTRDFVFVDDVVHANIKAATQAKPEAFGHAFNIGSGRSISINELYECIARELGTDKKPLYEPPRAGDVRDSSADINAARNMFGYEPSFDVEYGLKKSIEWYKENLK